MNIKSALSYVVFNVFFFFMFFIPLLIADRFGVHYKLDGAYANKCDSTKSE